MSVIIRGDGLVQVWSGDPTYGTPREGVFYMEPPYTDEQFGLHSQNRAKRWVGDLAGDGQVQTTKFAVQGPFAFLDVLRRDLSPEHQGDDEWVITAWFKRADGKPEVLPMSDVDERRQLAERYGLVPPLPMRHGQPAPKIAPLLADEMDDYRDPNGLDEAGLAEGSEL